MRRGFCLILLLIGTLFWLAGGAPAETDTKPAPEKRAETKPGHKPDDAAHAGGKPKASAQKAASDWVAPLTPRKVEVPKASGPKAWAVNPIDRFIAAYLIQRKIDPPAAVDDVRYARRVYLDVIGLLPTTEQLEKFVKDKRSDKRAKLVDELLADKDHYAQNWLTFWNDALRNDYKGTGYIDGGRKQITGWLYSALADNMPFDQFVRELVDPKPEAEGFINGIIWRGVVNASQVPEVQAAQNVSQVFMGLNLKCASCHDSFINNWTLADAYGFAGVFAKEPLEMHHCDTPIDEYADVKFLYEELGEIDGKAPLKERRTRLAEVMTSPQNGRLTRTMVNRMWAKFLGRGLVEPVDEMDRRPWNADLLDWLAADLAEQKYDLKHTIRLILTSQTYQMPAAPGAAAADDKFVFAGPLVRRMSAEQFVDAAARVTRSGFAVAEAKDVKFTSDDAKDEPVRASFVSADRLMVALGRPNRSQVVTSRPSLATTLEALELTNGPTLASWLHKGGKAWASDAANYEVTSDRMVNVVYQQALGRAPNKKEMTLAKEIVGEEPDASGMEDLLWAVLMLPEFQLIY